MTEKKRSQFFKERKKKIKAKTIWFAGNIKLLMYA